MAETSATETDAAQSTVSQADAARARIAATVDEIQTKLDPRRMVREAVDRAQDTGLEMVGRAGTTVRAHPLAMGAALAAIGVALFARNRLSQARVDLGDGLTSYTDYDDGYDEAVEQRRNGKQVPRQVQSLKTPANAAAVSGTIVESPLVSIVIGLAAGAALGALLPAGEAERRAIGSATQKLGAAARRAVDGFDDQPMAASPPPTDRQ